MALTFSDAKGISIVEYLSRAGFEPARVIGNSCWYHSPFRNERTPSFKVDTKLNLWYDHGCGQGGTIIDLGIRLQRCSPAEFLENLSRDNYIFKISFSPRKAETKKLEILSSAALADKDLLRYVSARGIAQHFARQYCNEVLFQIGEKTYRAIGFRNASAGYELRNRWFKGSSSPKDITFFDNGASTLCVAEGFMDFLSLLTLSQRRIISLPLSSNFLVLNSLSFISRSLPFFQRHRSNHFFLDNDLAAREAMKLIAEHPPEVIDRSNQYAPFKDVNEFLINARRSRDDLGMSRRSLRGP